MTNKYHFNYLHQLNTILMKKLVSYFKKRTLAIDTLLETPTPQYTAETFHQLRVEIKKLNTIFDLIKFCNKDFKQKKTFKPFKLIFRQAGKIRELQLEEVMLNVFISSELVPNYFANLKALESKEQESFFAIINQKLIARLKKKYAIILPFLHSIKKKKARSYIQEKKNAIQEILHQNNVQKETAHELRKRIKILNYAQISLSLDKHNPTYYKKDALPTLLGKWHDYEVFVEQLERDILEGKISKKEANPIKKIIKKIVVKNDLLFEEINRVWQEEKDSFF